ncbi:hypothetical protein SAMN04489761_0337 [Tenacibaculum sp. MAR_2009_124]|uniref:hypothetical protein n=1 Tax=Tenacibaculum sp. MAR_2009_124 TaxID=1250059 RepID=UPI00089D132C|nr:hypothetical protein [Tenacibaculum sp. MAR_2009_124]SEB38461.1 hypothetical protein SAMN04489761_0337 [Tenacibaculum sp. MAR_2009_124]
MKINDLVKKISSLSHSSNIRIIMTLSTSKISTRFYHYINEEWKGFWVEPIEYSDFRNHVNLLYENRLYNFERRFNKLEVSIDEKGNYKESYSWDNYKEREDKIIAAKYFFQWLNETMMNRIFEYEKENDLLTPNYDEDGDFVDYQSSYEKGVFTFTIKDNSIIHEIELLKGGVNRKSPMILPIYMEKAILEHFNMTNNDLRNEWDSWNKLVINCPHNSIPYDKWSDYVFYSLEDL